MSNAALAPHASNHRPPWLKYSALSAGGVAAAVMLAPTILPFFGVGTEALAESTVDFMHDTGNGGGIAGAINALLKPIPYIGETLANGGIPTAGVVAGLGVGGFFTGRFIEKRQSPHGLNIGKMIRYAALASSMLIALPSALTAIGVGLVYIAQVSDPELGSSLGNFLKNTLGVTGDGGYVSGLGGIAATMPHLFTCGASVIAGVMPVYLAENSEKPEAVMRPETMQQMALPPLAHSTALY